jgi:hypothetical protein
VKRPALLLGVAMLLIAALRLWNLGALPLFNDEVIYLRWAQIIATQPSLAVRIPLTDPKPPLHSAVLAAALKTGGDPLLSGRVVSVIAGILMIPLLALLVRDLGGSSMAMVAAAAFAATSPFLSFYQRLATADALFATEVVLCIWLALRMRSPVPLGLALGAALLTRQVFSVVLVPVTLISVVLRSSTMWSAAALAAALPSRTKSGGYRRRTPDRGSRVVDDSWRWLCAVGIAVLLLLPYVLSEPHRYSGRVAAELRLRMFHHTAAIEMPASDRFAIVKRNLASVLAPDGWMWHYLTPPLYVASGLALVWLLFRKPRSAVVLLVWFGAFAAPTIVFAVHAYPRYALAAVIPLLIAAALAIGDMPRIVAAIGLIALSVLPVRDTFVQVTRWQRQHLLPVDRWQYISGWPAGGAMEDAYRWLDARIRVTPSTLITGEGWGIPDDAVWVRYEGHPRAALRYVASNQGVPTLGTTPTFSRTLDPASTELAVPAHGPVYYVARFIGKEAKPVPPGTFVEDPVVFTNPTRETFADGVVIYRLR